MSDGSEINIPRRFPVAVMLSRRPSTSRWVSHTWTVAGVVVSSQESALNARGERVRTDSDGTEDYLWGGIPLQLYKDQVESYYHNLMAPQPALYVILRRDEQGQPYPFRVSASYDEANAYIEGDDDAQPVPMPAEVCEWVEHFVLAYYLPERPIKRKRQNWKENSGG